MYTCSMDRGQVCVDFLIAITIIAFGIVILISQIPMLFAPMQTVATDIQPVAYRTSMILVEDGGIYNMSGNITSKWEDPEGNGWSYDQNKNLTNYHDNVKRIGLAMSAPAGFSSEDIIPNKLSRDKINATRDWSNDTVNQNKIRDKLGLFVTYNGIPLNYQYNISLRDFNDNLLQIGSSPVLQIGDSIPGTDARYANATRVTIEKIDRIVAIDNPTALNCKKIGDVQCAKLVVCIWR